MNGMNLLEIFFFTGTTAVKRQSDTITITIMCLFINNKIGVVIVETNRYVQQKLKLICMNGYKLI